MALAFLIVLATAHLEDVHFVVLAVLPRRWLSRLRRTPGRTDLEFSAVTDCQHLIDHNFLAYVRSNLFYFNFSPEATRYCLPPVL